jgi:hypothetical protein
LSPSHGESYESLFARGSSIHQKLLKFCTNQLVVWFVKVHVNNWTACHLSKSHPGAPTCPFTPKVLRTKEHAPIPSPSALITFGLAVEFLKELEGASKAINNDIYKSLILCPSPNVIISLSLRKFHTLSMSTCANPLDYILRTKLIVIWLEMLVTINRSLEEFKRVTSNAKHALNVLYSCNHY